MKKWLSDKRVLPRWKLLLLILKGVWVGYVFDYSPYFALFFGLLMVWEIIKK